jgi:lipopolysaccharide export system permease protein
MNTYFKFLSINYIKSIIYVFAVMFCLVIILNILSEIEFFKNNNVNSLIPIYLALLNSFDLIFEMFPFIFLIGAQVFFVNLFTDNQINIFKYSGLKNSKILMILVLITFFLGLIIITFFYSFSSNLKSLYLDYKNKYTNDNKYLAVITNNGFWIKDITSQSTLIINASEINQNLLKNVNISEFDKNFDLIRIITSENVNINSNNWILYDANIVKSNSTNIVDELMIYSNFNFEQINNLFSNLSSLSILELLELRENYKRINYSTIEIDIQLQKLLSYPIYFALMSLLSAIIMFNVKQFKSTSLKIIIGLMACVAIYYLNNLSQVLGNTEKIPLILSVWMTLIILAIFNTILFININEK